MNYELRIMNYELRITRFNNVSAYKNTKFD